MKNLVGLDYELIITIVESGASEEVVELAKGQGAKGATTFHGRGSGVHDTARFFGLEIEPEKDIVLVLVPHVLTNRILKAISEGLHMDQPGNGICFVIDVKKIIGITQMTKDSHVMEIDNLLDLDD